MRKLYAALATAAVIAIFPISAAYAGGSDDPTPYTVTTEGVQLPDGVTFPDGGHVNIKSNQGDRGIHFESLNNQPSGKWIGKSFLPWEAFGLDASTLCVSWVQISIYKEHFGEGGQSPIGKGCEPWPTTTPSSTPEPSPTPSESTTPTASPSPSPSATSTPTPTVTPSSSPSPEPTTSPTSTPTSVPYPSNSVQNPPIPDISTESSPSLQTLPETGGNSDWVPRTIVAAIIVALGITLLIVRPRKVK